MVKILKIEKCVDCKHIFLQLVGGDTCNVKGKKINKDFSIPGWCPLEDYPDSDGPELVINISRLPTEKEIDKTLKEIKDKLIENRIVTDTTKQAQQVNKDEDIGRFEG